ncbi:class I SAM-dependent methyltransferase [Pseudomonas oryzihabitans]|uniref:class I SAM-dependent methyltransferase n=1 Tax=Pseudomonas oryzihabitans TaxID=47885 RepID=UPI00123884CB|nr:class I SAM-dependent methyltransferase [Pseudomonas oryzihabitans]QEU05640.1 class I SAM-dependent methyltransferase [Pseudomonas oryzihabitans]
MNNFFRKLQAFFLRAFGISVLTESLSKHSEKHALLAAAQAEQVNESLLEIKKQLQEFELVHKNIDQRTQSLMHHAQRLGLLEEATETRTRTLEFEVRNIKFAFNYQLDLLQKIYSEWAPALTDRLKGGVAAGPLFEVKTSHPIAYESNDHLNPDSTLEGIYRNTIFVKHCMDVLGKHFNTLDLGTGSGGIVFEFFMSGINSIGIDGSDFCKKHNIGYWPLIPNKLYTCDITKPYIINSSQSEEKAEFDLITMWEVLEHIQEDKLDFLLKNIVLHLKSDGYFMGSISFVPYEDEDGNPYHVTLKPKSWWVKKFDDIGLVWLEPDQHPFETTRFPRGNGPRFQDFHNYRLSPEDGCHFVARLANQ